MAILKLDHVSILANEPEAVLNFYKDFLGFKLVSERTIKEMGMTIYDLKRGSDYIEVIEPSEKGKMTDGIKHIAFLSDNIEEDLRAFKDKGALLLHKEVQRHINLGFFFAKSPTGEFVEVIQYYKMV